MAFEIRRLGPAGEAVVRRLAEREPQTALLAGRGEATGRVVTWDFAWSADA